MSRKRPLVSIIDERPTKRQKTTETVMAVAPSSSSMVIDTNGPIGTRRYTVNNRPRRLLLKKRGRKLTRFQKHQAVQSFIRMSELKFCTATQAASQITATGALAQTLTIPQGVTDSDRAGDRIMWCGTIEVNLQVVNGQGATGDAYNNVRFILFQWHPNSTTSPPTIAQILLPGPGGAQDIYSCYNHDHRSEYTILFDEVFLTVGNGNTATNPPQCNVSTGVRRIRISTRGMTKQAQFTAGATTGTNMIYLFQVSDSALATHPTTAYEMKAFYRDF